ncbi:unnamed protein product [Brachionus calyciflorus]|uniref:Uncharacterized protein n=1 Tax=Brachionus calyciflorus TaxID=104777 RepID=A0A813VLP3_9BILA|nr:unnamed protein product [Brachionus calyciflorus]
MNSFQFGIYGEKLFKNVEKSIWTYCPFSTPLKKNRPKSNQDEPIKYWIENYNDLSDDNGHLATSFETLMNSTKSKRKSLIRKKSSLTKKNENEKLKDKSNSELSRIITSRYTTEPYNCEQQKIDQRPKSSSSSITTTTALNNFTSITNSQFYTSHLDNLTSDLLYDVVVNDDDDDDDVDDKEDMNLSYFSTDDDESDLDYQNDLIDFDKSQNNFENNFVLKICNQIRSFSFVNNNKKNKSQETNNNNNNKETQDIQAQTTLTEYPGNFFEKTKSQEDFEYEYTEVILDDFRKVLDRYDATCTADYFIKKQLPSHEYFHKNEKIVDMYFILKRMLTKKKYVEATLKLERDVNKKKLKRNPTSSSSLKSRPSTAYLMENFLIDSKNYRPKTVNIIPIKHTNCNPIDDEDNYDTIDDEIITNNNNHNKIDYDCYYEPFSLDSNVLNQLTWPFELDFDLEKKPGKKLNKTKCKKLPDLIENNSKKIKNKVVVGKKEDFIPSSNSSKYLRCESAKNKELSVLKNASKSKLIVNNYNEEFNIDKVNKLDEDYTNPQMNIQVNKEEHLRKMNILPGKTFRSQRRKSISIEHVPVSKKKYQAQKSRILLTTSQSDVNSCKNNEKAVLAAATNGNEKFLECKSFVSLDTEASKKKHALAIEHQEIFKIINPDKSNGYNNKNTKTQRSHTCYPLELNLLKNRKETQNSQITTKNKHAISRPKTSKV